MTVEALIYVAGEWRRSRRTTEVIDPYRRETSALVHVPGEDVVDEAVRAARVGAAQMAEVPAFERAGILHRAANGVARARDALAERIVRDCGKCLKDARGEVERTVEILTLSAEEATRIEGSVVPLDALPLGAGERLGFALRFPVGVVGAIGPFNAPLHVIAHKLGPAFAAGNAVVCKPATQGSAVTGELVRIFMEAGLPAMALQLLPGGGADVGDALVRHPGIDMISFTGSGSVGESIVRSAGIKRVTLELSGNAAVVIHEDADWERAVSACIPAAYGIAGQSCVSLQRLYVHRSLFPAVAERAAAVTGALKLGDTLSPETDIGVMISEEAARRVEAWVGEAVSDGARILVGGRRDGAAIEPTVVVDVRPEMKLVCEEVFGPVVSVIPYDHIDEAIEAVNDSRWGLASGVFTRSLDVMLAAARRIRTGVLNVNAPSRYRVEHMPYGGLKLSGWGKEGPRYAILEMTDLKMVTVSHS